MNMSNAYRYTESGLDNIYLLSGFDYVETPRGKSAVIKDTDSLHLAIGRFLVREKKNLNGREFRFLRHELNLTQENLASVLRVDAQTVARWEKGHRTGEIPGAAQSLLRVMYEEHTNGNIAIRSSLQALAELDELLNEDEDEALVFEETEEGWQQAQLVA
jgi:putative transcriptional regulator